MAQRVSSSRQLAAHKDQRVELAGRYEVTDTSPHKVVYETPDGRMIQTKKIVTLVFTDGSGWVHLWVRPEAEMSRLDGQAVVATGRLILPEGPAPSDRAAPEERPSLVDIEAITAG
jgi:hypothetical protein